MGNVISSGEVVEQLGLVLPSLPFPSFLLCCCSLSMTRHPKSGMQALLLWQASSRYALSPQQILSPSAAIWTFNVQQSWHRKEPHRSWAHCSPETGGWLRTSCPECNCKIATENKFSTKHYQQALYSNACARARSCACAFQRVGMKPVERFVEQVDDVRKKKLSELVVTEEAAGPSRSQCKPPHSHSPCECLHPAALGVLHGRQEGTCSPNGSPSSGARWSTHVA